MPPLPQTRAINTFFILYTCSETSVFRWPRSLPGNVFLSSGEHNVVSYATLPEGQRNKNTRLIKNGEASNLVAAVTRSEGRRRQP